MSEFDHAFNIPPHLPSPSRGGFILPPTITTDFSKFIHQDTPGFAYTAKLIRDWEQKDDADKNPFIRCVMYPINWKSKFAAADEGVNIRTDFEHKIRKGDLILREDMEYYLLNWAVHNQVNNQPSQAKRCNLWLTIKRNAPREYDDDGMLISIGGETTLVDAMPACAYQYDGRPDYAPSYNTPGITADALTIIDLQWNPQTAKIVVNDEFIWGTSTFRIININMSGVDINKGSGLLQMHARRVTGGETV